MSELTAKAAFDERRLGRAAAIALPFVTIAAAAVVGLVIGPSMSVLVVAAGLLLGVIGLFWNSLRVLTGDAPLSPELEALEVATGGVDALATRRKMLLRALKDLDNEHSLGKLEDDDYAAIKDTYREELKVVLRRMDEALAPHRARAEEAARAYLAKEGLGDAAVEEAPLGEVSSEEAPSEAPARRECPNCKASNEADAKFCKGCAARLEETVDG